MISLFRSEIFKLSRRAMPRILLILLLLFVVGLYLLLWAASEADPEQAGDALETLRIGQVPDTGLGFVALVGSVLAIILAASLVASEFTWGTIRTVLPRTAGRSAFLTSQLLTLVVFVVVLVVTGFIAAIAASGLVTLLAGLDSDMGAAFVPSSAAAIGRTIFATMAYTALAYLIALWSRSVAAGIGIGLAVFFVEGNLTPLLTSLDALDWLDDVLMSGNYFGLLSANADEPTGDYPNPWRAAGVLAIYMSAFISLAYWRFLTRDITVS